MIIRITFIDIYCISFHTLSRQQFEKLFSTNANYPKVALAKLQMKRQQKHVYVGRYCEKGYSPVFWDYWIMLPTGIF